MTKMILPVEDNPSDEKLTPRAFEKSNVANDVNVVRDRAEAIEYLFGMGRHAERDVRKAVDFTEFALAAKTLGCFSVILNESPEMRRSGQ